MTYRLGKTQKSRKVHYALIAGGCLFLIFGWALVKKYGHPLIEPVAIKYGMTKQSLVIFPEFMGTYITTHKSLFQKNKSLEAQLETLENMLAQKDAVIRELEMKNNFFVATSTTATPPILLYPLMQDATKLYDTILLSKGFKDGVEVGDNVFIRGNQLACIVKDVYTSTSLCTIVSSSGMRIEGVTSSSSITLTLVGRGGHFLADVVRDTPVTVGEAVYLRSNPSIVLGTVKEVSNNNQDTSWHVFVQGAYNPVTSSIFYVQP